jgi:hypothetical protein
MKRSDIFFLLFLILLFIPFFISHSLYSFYEVFNRDHGFIAAFIKFGVLATSGELLGLRIRTGSYFTSGFGILPRAIVWGFLGLLIKSAFVIFAAGVPSVLSYLGMENPAALLASSLSAGKLLVAFSISFFLNIFFSPLLMTLHKITDNHIQNNNGTIGGLFSTVQVEKILEGIDWKMHWGFVLKKTIPFFWIPAHTITFLLPAEYQILFAALLGIVLGVILAFAAAKRTDK